MTQVIRDKSNLVMRGFVFFIVCFVLLFMGESQVCYAGSPELDVESIASASNGYGGAKVNIKLPSDYKDDYVYVLERSENCINWEKVGLTFEYSIEEQDICAKTIHVLNVYPDNQSFDLPQNFKDAMTPEQQQAQKQLYHIPDVAFTFADGTKKTLPKSAALKVWMEGGSYQDENGVKTFQSVAKYRDQQMINVDLMGMSQFNSSVNQLSDLRKYDVLFFGTWDANAWNDLTEQSRRIVEDFIEANRGVIFGHDTIACQIVDQGIYSGEVELNNFFQLRKYMNFETIPYSYKESSLLRANTQRQTLPLTYQIWGGSAENEATVRFFRAENKINSSLTTFPNNLLQEQGKIRDLKVPNTHTAWIGLKNPQQNVVCFAKNEYNILPRFISQSYANQPNMQYNWYLASGHSIYSCYMIQTGHSRCNSEIDERKLIANVLAHINKTEDSRKIYQSKIDVSAQDYAKPIVYAPIIDKNGNNGLNVKFQGIDEGTKYYFRVRILEPENGTVNMSEVKNVTVTTGIKNYYYIVDNKNNNYDFDINQAQKATLAQTQAGIACAVQNTNSSYVHIKAVDYAGNISEPFCFSLMPQFQPQLLPLEIESDQHNDSTLYQARNLNGIRNYYVKENAKFQLKLETTIQPFAYKLTQPYWNQINAYKVKTLLDADETGKKMDNIISGAIDDSIQTIECSQIRTDEFSKLSLSVNAIFKSDSDGKTVLLRPSGGIMIRGTEKKAEGTNEHCVYITCDGKGPEIEYDVTPYWHHAGNYNEAGRLNVHYKDSGSGFHSSTVNLKKRIDGNDKMLAYKTGRDETQSYMFYDALEEGIYCYEIYARDHVLNETRRVINFGVDKTPPVLHDLQDCYGWTNQNVTIRVTASDNLSGVKSIRLLDENGALISESHNGILEHQFTQEQDKAYDVEAEDVAGNICSRKRVRIKIDKTRPKLIGNELLDEYLDINEQKTTYYIPSNQIQAKASDLNEQAACSGMKSIMLKDQNERVMIEKKHINAGGSIVSEDEFTIEYEALSAQESDFYSIVAQDWAGNVRRIYIVPQICAHNRIRRTILHDNYEDRHGYYRIYE